MSETRIIGKVPTSMGNQKIYSVLADVKLEGTTFAACYDTRTKEWYGAKPIIVLLKWGYIEIKEYGESMEVPPEIIEEIKREQKEFDERRAAHKRGERLEE